jgi:hypothetical protein
MAVEEAVAARGFRSVRASRRAPPVQQAAAWRIPLIRATPDRLASAVYAVFVDELPP